MNFDSPIVSAFINLAVIVGILGIILLVIKKFGKRFNGTSDNDSLKIITKSSLSPKNHLYIVEIENKKLLIGANDNSISLISELNGIKDNNLQSELRNRKGKNFEDINRNKGVSDLSFKSFLKNSISKH